MANAYKLPSSSRQTSIFHWDRYGHPPIFRIEKFGGIDLSTTATQIPDNRSPDMLNMDLNEQFKPNKRPGYDKVNTVNLGSTPINGMYPFKKSDGTTVFLIAHGGKLYNLSDID